MNRTIFLTRSWAAFALAFLCLALVAGMSAQVQTTATTTDEPAAVETSVERGEIVYVQGNELVVKMDDGTLRHFPNVPESARANVDGKEIGIHEAKVGMRLEKTIITTATPRVVTTVQTVTGKVWHIAPPTTVILTLEDGSNQQFTIPKGQMFNIDGQMVDAWGLKKGMTVTATKIVEVPETYVSQEKTLTGTAPTPPPPDTPLLVSEATPAPTQPPVAAVPAELPKTASPMPLLGFLGFVSLGLSLLLRAVCGEWSRNRFGSIFLGICAKQSDAQVLQTTSTSAIRRG